MLESSTALAAAEEVVTERQPPPNQDTADSVPYSPSVELVDVHPELLPTSGHAAVAASPEIPATAFVEVGQETSVMSCSGDRVAIRGREDPSEDDADRHSTADRGSMCEEELKEIGQHIHDVASPDLTIQRLFIQQQLQRAAAHHARSHSNQEDVQPIGVNERISSEGPAQEEVVGGDDFTTEGELLEAIQRHVDATIAKLDAGRDYDECELNEAIVRRRLEKNIGLGAAVPMRLDADGHPIPPDDSVDGRLPPLFVPSRHLLPSGQVDFDDDSEDEDRMYNELDRPPSTNDASGIRPYVPPPGLLTALSRGGSSAAAGASDGSLGARPTNCLLGKFSRCSKSFACWTLMIPFGFSVLCSLLLRYAGGTVCGEACACGIGTYFVYLFTYGWLCRIVPHSVFFAYVTHIVIYAQQKHVLAAGGSLGEAVETIGARAMMALSSARRHTQQATHSNSKHRNDGHQRRALPSGSDVVHTWDIPSFRFCAKQRSFLFLCLGKIIFASVADSCGLWRLPSITLTPIEAGAFFVPTVSCCFFLRVPEAVWPLLLLEAVPFLAYFVEPRLQWDDLNVFFEVWPFFVILFERVAFYLFRVVCLDSTPLGIRVSATTMLGFTSHALILGASLFVDPTSTPRPAIAMCVQIFLYELLFGTVALDRFWLYLKGQFYYWVLQTKQKTEEGCLSPTDLRCISTQTRWTSQCMAILATSVVFMWRMIPRRVVGGTACLSGSIEAVIYSGTFAACVGAYMFAAFLTALIRRHHGCLRPPLMTRGRGLPMLLGCYLFMTAGMSLAAGSYGFLYNWEPSLATGSSDA